MGPGHPELFGAPVTQIISCGCCQKKLWGQDWQRSRGWGALAAKIHQVSRISFPRNTTTSTGRSCIFPMP